MTSLGESSVTPAPTIWVGDDADGASVTAAIDAAAVAFEAGEAVIVPTDTVYGVAALPAVDGAIAGLFRLKGRVDTQAVAVLVADVEQGLALTDLRSLSEPDRALVHQVVGRGWPGALTLVLPRRQELRHLPLGGNPDTIGIRCPSGAIARALARRVGPFAATSANRSGEPTPHDAATAAAALPGVALTLDAGPCQEPASTVVAVSADGWIVLRRGALDPATVGVPLPVAPSGEPGGPTEQTRVAEAMAALREVASHRGHPEAPS